MLRSNPIKAMVLSLAITATALVVPQLTTPASAAVDPPGVSVTIFAPSARWADTIIDDDWFDGLVVLNPLATASEMNTWTWGLQKTGPDGQTYRRLHHIVAGECLSHVGDVLMTLDCDVADDRQWWAIEEFPCAPGAPICFRMLMKPLDEPGKAVTEAGDLLMLQPRESPNGIGHRLLIVHV